MIEAQLTYSAPLIRNAALAYLRRGLGISGLGGTAILTMGVVLDIALNKWGWRTGVEAGAVMVLLGGIVALYFTHYRLGMEKLRRMEVPHATIKLTDTEFRVVTKTATFSTIWSTFTELWRFPDFWLLIMGKGQYVTLPTADLTPQARDLIVARIQASGGKT
jgi:hypothetical protein